MKDIDPESSGIFVKECYGHGGKPITRLSLIDEQASLMTVSKERGDVRIWNFEKFDLFGVIDSIKDIKDSEWSYPSHKV